MSLDEYVRDNRIKEALRIRHMRQIELAEKTGLTRSSINNWSTQRWQPKQNAIYLMAKALNVSEMWLAGYDVPMERSQKQIKNDEISELLKTIQTNDKVQELFIKISKLNSEQLETIESMVNQLIKIKEGE